MFIWVWHSQGTRQILWIGHSTTTWSAFIFAENSQRNSRGEEGVDIAIEKRDVFCHFIFFVCYSRQYDWKIIKTIYNIFLKKPLILEILIYKINRHACIMLIGYRNNNLKVFVLMSMNSFIWFTKFIVCLTPGRL